LKIAENNLILIYNLHIAMNIQRTITSPHDR